MSEMFPIAHCWLTEDVIDSGCLARKRTKRSVPLPLERLHFFKSAVTSDSDKLIGII